jgi:uncharacterized protein
MKYRAIGIIFVVILAILGYYFYATADIKPTEHTTEQSITIGRERLNLEVVASPQAQVKGLSGRESLPWNYGMLFDFRNSASKRPSFWMKEMRFDLDIIWIKDGGIIGITTDIPAPNPNTPLIELPRYTPPSAIDYALEVNAGWSDAHGIEIGDMVEF